jgi:hypothetical protein
LVAYVAVVEQRTPVLRAALMAAIVVVGGFFFRRLELLNSAAIAALLLLVGKPSALGDSSFQLSFLAIVCIGGLALPWLTATVQPYARALRGWRDVTKDASFEPRPTQFRIDLRLLARVMETRFAFACSDRDGAWQFLSWGVSVEFSRLGVVCADAGFADRDVAAAGECISPNYLRRRVRKFCGGAADGHYCSIGVFYADWRIFTASIGQVSGSTSLADHLRTSSCSAAVRACTAIELSDSGSAPLGND